MANNEVSFTVKATDSASAALTAIQKSVQGVADRFTTLKSILATFAAVLPAISLGVIIKDMIDLGVAADATWRQIAANLPTGIAGIRELQQSIVSLAETSGRSLEEVQQTAIRLSQVGASDAGDLAQRLQAVTILSDATGASMSTSTELLTTVMREFHLSGQDALQTVAKLANAAQGHVSMDELVTVFGRAALVFEKFGIDADTGTKAIIALVSSGLNARQMGTVLNGLDATGIRDLAAQSNIASDALAQLVARAQLVEDGTGRAEQRIRTGFNAALESMAAALEPLINGGLQSLQFWLDGINKVQTPGLKDQIQDLLSIGAMLENGHFGATTAKARAGDLSSSAFATNELFQAGTFSPAALTLAQAQQLHAALVENIALQQQLYTGAFPQQAAANLQYQYSGLLDATGAAITAKQASAKKGPTIAIPESAADKTKDLTAVNDALKMVEAQAESTAKAVDATTSSVVDNLQADLDAFMAKSNADIEKVQADLLALSPKAPQSERDSLTSSLNNLEVGQALGQSSREGGIDQAKGNEALATKKALLDALARATGNLAEITKQANADQIDKLQKQLDLAVQMKTMTDDERASAQVQIDQIKAQGDALVEVQTLTGGLDAKLKQIALDAKNTIGTGGVPNAMAQLDALKAPLLVEQNKLAAEGLTDSRAYQEVQKEILAIEEMRHTVNGDLTQSIKAQLTNVQQQAEAIKGLVDGALQLAGAFGVINANTVQVLGSITQAATAIGPLIAAIKIYNGENQDSDGNPIESIGSLVGLANPLIGGITAVVGLMKNSDAANAQHTADLLSNTEAIRELTAGVTSLGNSTLSGSETSSLVANLQQFLSTIPSGLAPHISNAGAVFEDQFGAAAWAQLQAAAKAAGISLDGTVSTFEQLFAALQAGQPGLYQFGKTFDDAMKGFEAYQQALGTQDPLTTLNAYLGQVGQFSTAVQGLVGMDPATAKQTVLGWIAQAQAGTLTAFNGSGIPTNDFGDVLSTIATALNNVLTGSSASTGATSVVTSGLQSLSTVQGDRIGDLLLQIMNSSSITANATTQMASLAAARDSIARSRGQATDGGSTVSVSVGQVTVTPAAGATVGQAAGAALTREVDQRLAANALSAARSRGDITVLGSR